MKNKKIFEKSHKWHQASMDAAFLAFRAQKKKQLKKAHKHFVEAFELERKAAMELYEVPENEPTCSIYFRSAAWLAYHAGKYREAERMAAFGLSGNPPKMILDELREVQETISLKIKESSLTAAA